MSLLVDLQGYRMLPQGAAERKLATLQVLLERQDVREAVNEVGRIESFDVFQY